MTNTTKTISYVHPRRSTKLALTPGMTTVWVTGPRAGQRADDVVPAPRINYTKAGR